MSYWIVRSALAVVLFILFALAAYVFIRWTLQAIALCFLSAACALVLLVCWRAAHLILMKLGR